jgi:hypothetical protein
MPYRYHINTITITAREEMPINASTPLAHHADGLRVLSSRGNSVRLREAHPETTTKAAGYANGNAGFIRQLQCVSPACRMNSVFRRWYQGAPGFAFCTAFRLLSPFRLGILAPDA